MNKKEYTSPSISVSKCEASLVIMESPTLPTKIDPDSEDNLILGKGTDIWDEDEGDDFGW
ncbi:MAG: hypothetical protein LUI08_02645 [Prevotella sp.]|nr:hypothetical protein [Prevotella sp.]